MNPDTRRAKAFTLLEIVIVVCLMAVIGFSMFDAYRSGIHQHMAASESLSAIQSSLVLMDTIQEDLRQLAILNFRDTNRLSPIFAGNSYAPLQPSLVRYSMYFSQNGKSFMFRKSTTADTNGKLEGSSFSVVIYHLFREAGLPPGTYKIRRIERFTDGTVTSATGLAESERDIRSLLLKDVRFDLVVRLDSTGAYAYQTFVRVSVTAVNSGAAQSDDRVFFVSNLFNVISPEFVNNRPGEVGFARRFDISLKWTITPPDEVLAGEGFYEELPPTGWPDFATFVPFMDYLDSDGSWKNMPVPATAGGLDPFSGTAPSTKTGNFCNSARDFIQGLVGKEFRGHVTGLVPSRSGVTPPFAEGYDFDATPAATQPIVTQIQSALQRVATHGTDAVEDMGHMLAAEATPGQAVISDADASAIISGQ